MGQRRLSQSFTPRRASCSQSGGSRGQPVAFFSCFWLQMIVAIAQLAAWHLTRSERLQKKNPQRKMRESRYGV